MDHAAEQWKAGKNADVILKVREAQIQQLYSQTWSGLAGIMIIMLPVCVILWEAVPQWKLLLWAGVLVLLSIARGLLAVAFQRKRPSGPDIYRWARMHVIGTIASGVMWALPSFFLWPENSPEHQMVWPICITALAASVVAKFCSWKSAYFPYLVLTMLSVSLRLFLEGELTHIVLGLLGLVFTVVMAQTGNMMYSTNSRVLEVGFRNEALSSFLSAENAKEEKLNEQLQQEITERTRSQGELQLRNEELELLNTQLTSTKNSLESAYHKLERALGDVKQLSGMLPICSSCKKIRNDSGYWEQIEAYIRDHSGVEFSHSICPDCVNKLYPGLLKKDDQ